MSLRKWVEMLMSRRGVTPPMVEAEASPVADTAEIDRKQLEALQRLRRVESRLRAYQVEADIIRGD